MKQEFDLNKKHFICLTAVLGVSLAAGIVLLGRFNLAKEDLKKSKTALNEALPGLDSSSPELLKDQIRVLKTRLMGFSALFDPKEKWLKADYDPTIYFVEELGTLNQFLRQKSVESNLTFPDIAFKEKLPSEQEAPYLLSQLFGIREVVRIGMEHGIIFRSITPLGIEDLRGVPGIKTARTHMEMSCPASQLMEFLIHLEDAIPKVLAESLTLKSKGDVFDIDLTMVHIMMELPWKGKKEFLVPESDLKKILPAGTEESIRVLRNISPFVIPRPPELAPEVSVAAEPAIPPGPRFIFRGIARLKSKEVVVIEDTLNKTTLFLKKGEKIGSFTVKDFSEKQAVLEDPDAQEDLVIKQEER
jgi:hypothetical protein